MTNPQVDICIPTYYAHPETPRVLQHLVDSINEQSYDNIAVCTALQSGATPDENHELTSALGSLTKQACCIVNDHPGPANNTNAAITLGHGKYVKIMNHDDFLDDKDAIAKMVAILEANPGRWLVTACEHTDSAGAIRNRLHQPFWPGEKNMVEGVNRLGCPSVAIFPRDIAPWCDPDLALCMDCAMWIDLARAGGEPLILREPLVVIRGWEANLSNQINYAQCLETDKRYMRSKYGHA